MFKGFLSADHERSMMINHPKMWKEFVRKFGHHVDFDASSVPKDRRRVGGVKRSSKRHILKYGRKKR